MLARGSTFLFGSPNSKLHLHIILTEPENGEAVVISVTTLHPDSKAERHVVLRQGDHPFISQESVPAYRFANFFKIERIEDAIARGEAKPREDASPDLIGKILSGLIDSDLTPNHVRQYCKNALP